MSKARRKRLIEVAFPLEEVSAYSRREKNVWAAWPYLDAAHLVGAASAGGLPRLHIRLVGRRPGDSDDEREGVAEGSRRPRKLGRRTPSRKGRADEGRRRLAASPELSYWIGRVGAFWTATTAGNAKAA